MEGALACCEENNCRASFTYFYHTSLGLNLALVVVNFKACSSNSFYHEKKIAMDGYRQLQPPSSNSYTISILNIQVQV